MKRRKKQTGTLAIPASVPGRIRRCAGAVPRRFLYVTIASQRLCVVDNNAVTLSFPVSTSRFGAGNRDGSLMTPRGVHRVAEKIGHGAPRGRIFRDRKDTGETWDGCACGDNLILTRIIRLEGCEDGVNRGPGIDSYERYIYIHGTDKEERIGTPLSHGCVCMRNDDIVTLFDAVEEGTVVVID